MISIGLPSTVGPNSSTAICAATTDPGPLLSRPQLDRSVRTPIRTTSSEICADAACDIATSMAQAKAYLLTAVSPRFLFVYRRIAQDSNAGGPAAGLPRVLRLAG